MDAAALRVVVTADTSKAEAGLNQFSSKLQNTARNLGGISAGMSLGITAPIVAAGAAVFNIGKDFESAFTGVIKTFSGTTAEAAVLRQGIRDMSKELPASAVEIATVAEAAGALGIEKENIMGFTRTIIDMGEATDLTTDQAANDMARFANVMKMPQDQFDNLGSSIVALGNDGASTESEILGMATRIAGAGSVIGLSEAQVLGWASSMSSMGIQSEAGGTAFSTVVKDMAKEVATGGPKLTKFAKVAGVSSAAFAKAFKEDASAATLMFIEGLGGIEEAGGNVFQTLEDLGLADVRVSDTLLRLSGNTDMVESALNTSNRAWEENIALTREAELRYATTDSKMAMMKNRISDVGITLFDTFKPAINAGIDGVSDFALGLGDAIQGFAAANPALISAAAAFAGVLAVAGPLVGVAAAVAFALSALGTAAAPILLVVGAVAALAAGFAYLYSIDFMGIQGGVAAIGTAVSGLVTTGIDNVAAAWNTVKPAIDTAIAAVKAWYDQISTQGLVSEETMIASYELPDNWGEVLRFTIGMGAALKTLNGAVTGDLGAAELATLSGIMDTAFGEEIATRISNIATHIGTLKTALADASTVGEWFTGVSSFATNVGTEIDAIIVDAKAQIKTAMDEIDVSITIGAANITWSPDMKSLEIPGVLTAQVTPEWVKAGAGALTVRATPEWVNIESGGKNVLQVSAEIIKFNLGDNVALEVTPTVKSFVGGPFDILVTPKWTDIQAGPLKVLVTPEFTKIDIGKSFGLQISAGGKIDIKLGAEDFTVDFSTLISTIQVKLATLSGEISSAFASEGWSGLGALAKEKISGVGTDMGVAFGEMVLFAQIGLLAAMTNLRTQFDTLMTGDSLNMIDPAKIGAWAQRQVTAAKAQMDTWFGEGNVGSQILDRVTATVGRIEETMAGVGDMAVGEQFNAAVMSILEVIGLVKGVNLDVVTAAATGLTTLTTAVIDFSAKLVGGLNADKLAEMLGGIATEISAAVKKAFDPANLTELGTSAGTMVSTLVGKLTELLGADEFGTNVGTAVAEATGAIALGATALVGGIVGELSKTPWASFSSGLNKFVGGFVIGVIEEIRKADWTGLVGALQESITNTFTGIGERKKAAEEAQTERMREMETPTWEGILGIPSLSGWLAEQLTPKGEGFFGFEQPAIETRASIMGWDVATSTPPLTGTVTVTGFELPPGEPKVEVIPTVTRYDLPPGEPQVEIIPQWGTMAEMAAPFMKTPIAVPIQLERITEQDMAGIIESSTTPITIPVTPKIEWPTGGQLSDILRERGLGSGGTAAIQEISMNVQVASAVAGPSLQPLLMPAKATHVDPPDIMPVIQVKGEMVNDLSQAGAGIGDAAAQGAAALSSSLGGFDWPELPPWTWPPIPTPGWLWAAIPTPSWVWLPIPVPTWLNQLVLPRPAWLGELLAWRPTVILELSAAPTTPGAIPGAAGGTNYWKGGPLWVGEEGPELLNLPRGSSVKDHESSMASAGGGGGGATVQITGPVYIRDDQDIEELALRITRIQERRARGLA